MRVSSLRIRSPRATRRESSRFRSLWGGDGRAALWVFLVACVAYAGALSGGFVYDDFHSVVGNPAIADPANIPAFFTDLSLFSQLDNRMYRPILLITFALDYMLWGLDAMGWKLTNVALHGLVSLLLFAVMRQRCIGRVSAFLGAACLGCHPLASQAVNAVSSRSDVLVLLGMLLSLWCYGLARTASSGAGRLLAAVGVAGGAVIACGAKATAVLLPGLLLADDILMRRGGWAAPIPWRELPRYGARCLARMAPALLVVFAYLWIRLELFGVATARMPQITGGDDPLTGGGRDLVTQLCSMAVGLPQVLGKVIWPADLTLQPPFPIVRTPWHDGVILGALGLLALVVMAIRTARRRPLVGLGLVLAVAQCLPWILLPLNVPISEHRMYGALAGISLAVGGLPWLRWMALIRQRTGLVTSNLRGVCAAVACVLLLAFGARSNLRSTMYADEGALWRHAVALRPDSHQALWGVAMCEIRNGRPREALGWLERAVATYPWLGDTRITLVDVHIQLGENGGQPFGALLLAEGLVEEQPRDPYRQILLAKTQIMVGDFTGDPSWYGEAESRALEILTYAKPKGLVYIVAAIAREKAGDPSGALELLDRSCSEGLDHFTVRAARCELAIRMGMFRRARQDLAAVMQATGPMSPMARRLQAQITAARPPR